LAVILFNRSWFRGFCLA